MALAGPGRTKGMIAQLASATTCNQSMAAIVPDERIHPRYTFWLLDAQYEVLRNLAGGEQRDGLNLEILGAYPSPSHPSTSSAPSPRTSTGDGAHRRAGGEEAAAHRAARGVPHGADHAHGDARPPARGRPRRRPRPLAAPQALGRRVARRRAGAVGVKELKWETPVLRGASPRPIALRPRIRQRPRGHPRRLRALLRPDPAAAGGLGPLPPRRARQLFRSMVCLAAWFIATNGAV